MLRVLPVVPLVLLAGCGVAGTEFHPGVAAQVGDETITSQHLDEVTDNYCTAIETISEGQDTGAQRTPMRYLSRDFASALVDKAATEQLAEEYGVEPSEEYTSSLAQLEPQLVTLDEDEQDAVREVIGAQAYTNDVLTQIGQQELQDQGKTDATEDDQLAAGRDVLQKWVDDHDVEINPRYGLEYGTDTQVDTDVSYPLGDTAKAGLAATADPDYTAELSGHLVCLD